MVKHGESLGSSGMCPYKRGFCHSGAGLEGFHCRSVVLIRHLFHLPLRLLTYL